MMRVEIGKDDLLWALETAKEGIKLLQNALFFNVVKQDLSLFENITKAMAQGQDYVSNFTTNAGLPTAAAARLKLAKEQWVMTMRIISTTSYLVTLTRCNSLIWWIG